MDILYCSFLHGFGSEPAMAEERFGWFVVD